MAKQASSLDAEVRRVDEDRWLASRFAPPRARARLTALYALNYELARTSEVVSEPGVGAIRLAWWRDAVNEIATGRPPRGHAALLAFAEAFHETPFDAATLRALIEARSADLEPVAFAGVSDLESYIRATASGVMYLAIQACGGGLDERERAFVHHAGLAWGLAGVLRAEPFWRARGRRLMADESCGHAVLINRARTAFGEARGLAPSLSSLVFPAIGYVAFAPGYLHALEHGHGPPTLLQRQLKLVGAAATGRL